MECSGAFPLGALNLGAMGLESWSRALGTFLERLSQHGGRRLCRGSEPMPNGP
jgi:hypothetical protein